MKNIYFCLMAMLCLSLSACKKGASSKTKTDYLTQKSWIEIAERSNTDNGAWTDEFGNYQACESDNILKLSKDGTFTIDEGASKCSVNDPQVSESGTWKLTSNETKLTVTEGGITNDITIQQVDDNSMVLVQEYTISGHTFKSEQTYKHP